MTDKIHEEEIIAQFTKQAKGYTAIASHSQALETLVKVTNASGDDTVLDVACGSGIVACEFAKHTAHVTGIDITEGMIDEARRLQNKAGLKNIDWHIGNVLPLPYKDNQFSIVISRFGFHHFTEPEKVLTEMIRVCKPGGFVVVADVALPDTKVDKYNAMEKLRDSSHVAALSISRFNMMLTSSGLKNLNVARYNMQIELEQQLDASFPDDSDKLKNLIINDIGVDELGINATRANNEVLINYPVHIFYGNKPQS